LSVFALAGCGIKGPPVPVTPSPLPPAPDLAYQLAGDTVTLTWRLAESLQLPLSRGAVFTIYRARTTLSEPTCDGCPAVFERSARVPYMHTDDGRFSHSFSLDAGYRYVFKVRLAVDGMPGSDSNMVRFDLPLVGKQPPTEDP